MRTLSADQALAAGTRQHALSGPGWSVEEITSRLVGLHNTSPVSPYLSLLARLPGFTRADLDDLMWGSWRLARIRAMRMTMFVFPHDLIEITVAATRHKSEAWAARWLRDSDFSPREFNRLAVRIEDALAPGPMTVRSLRQTLGVPPGVDLPGVVSRMCDVGRLAGGAPLRSWRSSIRQYHRWVDVLPDVNLRRWDEDDAICELIHRYVCTYGPVTVNDMSWWTGITKARCRAALETLDTQIEEVTVEGWPGPLFRARDSGVADDPGSEVHALPVLDPYVQGYKDRRRFLAPGRHEFVYDGGGNATATLVQGGRVVGVWQTADTPAESVRYHLFDGGPASTRRAARVELAAAGALYFDRPVDVVEMPTMKPLKADGGRSASHPLDERLHRASRHRRA